MKRITTQTNTKNSFATRWNRNYVVSIGCVHINEFDMYNLGILDGACEFTYILKISQKGKTTSKRHNSQSKNALEVLPPRMRQVLCVTSNEQNKLVGTYGIHCATHKDIYIYINLVRKVRQI